jgi:hypothetical protein
MTHWLLLSSNAHCSTLYAKLFERKFLLQKPNPVLRAEVLFLHNSPNPSINTDAGDKAAGAGYVKR